VQPGLLTVKVFNEDKSPTITGLKAHATNVTYFFPECFIADRNSNKNKRKELAI